MMDAGVIIMLIVGAVIIIGAPIIGNFASNSATTVKSKTEKNDVEDKNKKK